ncbi:hypothetical protein AC579_2440 [Pseudocercospora musae]|uniref:DUF6594 domain-containing protein n=1 Tax=Pseudocercospora musae TaxID=113226 RepID=A0A139HZF4_9PEZI|nr:hypothetical protein AC579_2440 [Pseudocercospora musae]
MDAIETVRADDTLARLSERELSNSGGLAEDKESDTEGLLCDDRSAVRRHLWTTCRFYGHAEFVAASVDGLSSSKVSPGQRLDETELSECHDSFVNIVWILARRPGPGVRAQPAAHDHHRRNIANWFITYRNAISDEEQHFLDKRHEGDLFPIISKQKTPLTALQEKVRVVRFRFRHQRKRSGRLESPDVLYHSDKGLAIFASIVVVSTGLLLFCIVADYAYAFDCTKNEFTAPPLGSLKLNAHMSHGYAFNTLSNGQYGVEREDIRGWMKENVVHSADQCMSGNKTIEDRYYVQDGLRWRCLAKAFEEEHEVETFLERVRVEHLHLLLSRDFIEIYEKPIMNSVAERRMSWETEFRECTIHEMSPGIVSPFEGLVMEAEYELGSRRRECAEKWTSGSARFVNPQLILLLKSKNFERRLKGNIAAEQVP